MLELISWHLRFEVNHFGEVQIVQDVPACNKSLVFSTRVPKIVLIENRKVNFWLLFTINIQDACTKCLNINFSVQKSIEYSIRSIGILFIYIF